MLSRLRWASRWGAVPLWLVWRRLIASASRWCHVSHRGCHVQALPGKGPSSAIRFRISGRLKYVTNLGLLEACERQKLVQIALLSGDFRF